MSGHRNDQILALIERLSNDLSVAREQNLEVTALLLSMAKLDLQMVLNSISTDELRIFTLEIAELAEQVQQAAATRSGG